MTDKEAIKIMYSKISASEKAIKNCIEMERRKRMIRFPMKKTFAIAVCIVILITAIAIPVVAYKSYRAYDDMEAYRNTLLYSDKVEGFNKISENSISLPTTARTEKIEGLTLVAQEAFYDGELIYISFTGEYDGEFKAADRFVYHYEKIAAFQVDGNSIVPNANHEFYVMKTENGFSGVLGLPYSSDKENLNVKISMPYLEVYSQDEIIGRIDGNFCFALNVEKTCDAFSFADTGSEKDIYIQSLVSAPSGTKLVFYVPRSIEESDANIIPLVTDEEGNSIGFIEGVRENTETGTLHIVRLESSNAKKVNVYLIDKNNIDGCSEDLCVIAEFKDIILT